MSQQEDIEDSIFGVQGQQMSTVNNHVDNELNQKILVWLKNNSRIQNRESIASESEGYKLLP